MESRLSDFCQIIMGQSPKGSSYNENYEGYPLLNGAADYKGQVFKPKKYTNKPTRLTKRGDIIFGIRATIGNFAISDKQYCIGRGIAAVRVNEDRAYVNYVIRFIKNELEKIIHRASGSTIKGIKKEDLTEMLIPIPPLPEQKRIAAILDEADKLRQLNTQLIEKYDALTQSLFLDMFGDPFTNKRDYPITKIGELCEEIFLGLTSKVDYVDEGGFPLIRAKDINKSALRFDDVKYISEKQHKKLTSKRITKKGDVLISKSGSLGTCAIVDTDREFSTYESIFTVRPNAEKLINKFLIYLVRSKGFQIRLLGKQVGGTVAHLNLKMFREFEFPLPPLSQQDNFVQRVQLIEQQKQQAQTALQKSEELFNSLLQKAFKGQL